MSTVVVARVQVLVVQSAFWLASGRVSLSPGSMFGEVYALIIIAKPSV